MATTVKTTTILKIVVVIVSTATAAIAQMWPASPWANLLTAVAAFLTGGVMLKRPGDIKLPVGTIAVEVPVQIDPQTLKTTVVETDDLEGSSK